MTHPSPPSNAPLRPIRFFATLFPGVALLFVGDLTAGNIILQWDEPTNDPRIAGYEIHYGPVTGRYGAVEYVEHQGNGTHTHNILNLLDGRNYHFVVRSADADRAQFSAFSNEVSAVVGTCSPTPLSVANITYANADQAFCSKADVGIGPNVQIANNSFVTVAAPVLTLGAGFRVEGGSLFLATTTASQPTTTALSKALSDHAVAVSRQPNDMTSVQHASWFPTAAPLRRAGRADLPSGLVERLDEIGGVVWGASIDPTGRYVVFASSAALTARDRNAVSDIYWYDSLHDQVVLVSAAPDGAAGDGPSSHPRMDRAGEVIVYQSDASDLVAGDQNTVRDIFLTDTAFWLTERLSMTVEGSETANPSSRPAIDHAGSQIVYDRADASGFRHIYSYATATMVTDRLSLGWDADGRRLDSYYPGLSPDGRFLVYTETKEAVGFEPGLCTVHVLDQVTAELWSGACPESLEKEAGFVPFFSSDALSIEWIADPGERLPEQEAVGGTPQGVSLENPFLTP